MTYFQVPRSAYVAAVDGLSQQTRGASNTLPHYPRTLKIFFLLSLSEDEEYSKLVADYKIFVRNTDLRNGRYKLQSTIAEFIITVEETLQQRSLFHGICDEIHHYAVMGRSRNLQ